MQILRNLKMPIIVYLLLYLVPILAQEIKLPPDPGRKNDETLLGIDANKNNVRDDVEIFIYKEITKDPKIYMAYLKYAESSLEIIKNHKDLSKLSFFDDQLNKDQACLNSLESYKESILNMKKLNLFLYNTNERRRVIKEVSEKHNSFAVNLKGNTKEQGLKWCRF